MGDTKSPDVCGQKKRKEEEKKCHVSCYLRQQPQPQPRTLLLLTTPLYAQQDGLRCPKIFFFSRGNLRPYMTKSCQFCNHFPSSLFFYNFFCNQSSCPRIFFFIGEIKFSQNLRMIVKQTCNRYPDLQTELTQGPIK